MSSLDLLPYAPFSVLVTPNRDEVAVAPVGELNSEHVDEVRRTVAELKETGFARLVLDLRQVSFIDSAGLRMLLGLRADARRDGTALTLIPAPRGAGRIFDITETRRLFDWRSRFTP